MKLQEIAQLIGADTISRREDVITVRKSYFYTFGKSARDFEARVLKAFPNAKIHDIGDHWVPFKGGHTVAQGTHWYVKFSLEDQP